MMSDGAGQPQNQAPTRPRLSDEGTTDSARPAAAAAAAPGGSAAVFFARVPPTVPSDGLLALFAKFGTVKHLNLYRRWATAKTSKGCGIVEYGSQDEAQAAIEGLSGLHKFDGYPDCDSPMVVEWMDASRLTPPSAPKQRKQGGSSSGKSQPKHKVANNASTHNNSSGSCSNQALGWQWAQQLSALAYSRGAAAASAAAQAAQAAAAGYSVAQQQQHPAGVFGIQPTADNYAGLACLMRQQAADVSAGLGDPLSWSSVVPVHMLPMMDADKARGMHCMPEPQPPPQHQYNTMMQYAAAAAGAAHNPMSPVGGSSLDSMVRAGLVTLEDPTYQAASACGDAWLSNHSLSGSLLAPQMQQQLGAGLPPLVLPGDDNTLGALDSFSGLMSATSHTGSGGAGLSSSYSLFDSSAAFLGQLHEAATSGGGVDPHAIHSPSTLGTFGVPAWAGRSNSTGGGTAHSEVRGLLVPGSLSGAVSPHLSSLLLNGQGQCDNTGHVSAGAQQARAPTGSVSRSLPLEGAFRVLSCTPDQPDTASVQDRGAAGAQGQRSEGPAQEGGRRVLNAAVADQAVGRVAKHLPQIAKISGAELKLNSSPQGTLIRVEGCEADVSTARSLLCMLGVNEAGC